jgi:hypothetical protein
MLKWTGKLVVLSLALSLWASPLVACMLPDAALTTEERECCKDMANQCGQMEMPASHSCCRLTVREGDYLINARITVSHPQLIAAPLSPSADILLPANLTRIESLTQTHAPPDSPPGTVSILRI